VPAKRYECPSLFLNKKYEHLQQLYLTSTVSSLFNKMQNAKKNYPFTFQEVLLFAAGMH